jgi:hypothetical protein
MSLCWAHSSAWIEWLPAEQLVEGSSPSGPAVFMFVISRRPAACTAYGSTRNRVRSCLSQVTACAASTTSKLDALADFFRSWSKSMTNNSHYAVTHAIIIKANVWSFKTVAVAQITA